MLRLGVILLRCNLVEVWMQVQRCPWCHCRKSTLIGFPASGRFADIDFEQVAGAPLPVAVLTVRPATKLRLRGCWHSGTLSEELVDRAFRIW